MRKKSKTYIFGNWKMNGSCDMIEAWLNDFEKGAPALDSDYVIGAIFPPAPYISLIPDIDLLLGIQTCHAQDAGAFTGEISAAMADDLGVTFGLVGHSERRALGETDADVVAKVQALLRHNITPVVCIGETLEQRKQDQLEAVLRAQLAGVLDQGQDIIIAYEPVWAIGTGIQATLEDMTQAYRLIRGMIPGAPILYGGSVTVDTAADILRDTPMEGLLIGGASLNGKVFSKVLQIAHELN